MRSKGLKLLAILAMLPGFATLPAAATGDLICTIKDENIDFTLFGSTGREHGTIVNVVEGSLALKTAVVARIGREFNVEHAHIVQQWFLQGELRIGININGDNGSLLLAIVGEEDRSKADDVEVRYSGRYVLTLYYPDSSTQTASGPIKGCSAG